MKGKQGVTDVHPHSSYCYADTRGMRGSPAQGYPFSFSSGGSSILIFKEKMTRDQHLLLTLRLMTVNYKCLGLCFPRQRSLRVFLCLRVRRRLHLSLSLSLVCSSSGSSRRRSRRADADAEKRVKERSKAIIPCEDLLRASFHLPASFFPPLIVERSGEKGALVSSRRSPCFLVLVRRGVTEFPSRTLTAV